jgi:two-component system, sensor histidine kinase YesM
MIKYKLYPFKHIFKNLNIKKKLLLAFFSLIIIPLILLTYTTNKTVSQYLEDQVKFSALRAFDQADSFLNYKLNYIIRTSDVLYNNDNIQDILTRDISRYRNEIIQQQEDASKLSLLFSSIEIDDIQKIQLYATDELVHSNEDISFININYFDDSVSYNRKFLSRDKVLWLPPESIFDETIKDNVPVIPLLRGIRNIKDIKEFIGLLKIYVVKSQIQGILENANITKQGLSYIINSKDKIICSSDDSKVKEFAINRNNLETHLHTGKNWGDIRIRNSNCIILCRTIYNSDWTLVSIIPYGEIQSAGTSIRNQVLVIMLLICGIAYFVAFYLSKLSTKRIHSLTQSIRKVQKGEFDTVITSDINDEIGELENNYNFMIRRIVELIDEQYFSGQQVKQAELKALQAQINPHFLYNTLDLIKWKALEHDVPDIESIVISLAKFYKLSLNKGKEIVSLEDEIMHVSVYVEIQNQRFENQIKLILDIDDSLYNYSILKIILQPIVENSILHGILEKANNSGTIKITGTIESEIITLVVEDDGIGMSEEKLENLFIDESSSQSNGYGVKNINNRIKLNYGNQFGLSYSSSEGQGTRVKITIPAVPI